MAQEPFQQACYEVGIKPRIDFPVLQPLSCSGCLCDILTLLREIKSYVPGRDSTFPTFPYSDIMADDGALRDWLEGIVSYASITKQNILLMLRSTTGDLLLYKEFLPTPNQPKLS